LSRSPSISPSPLPIKDSDTTKLQNELSAHWPTISDKADIGNIIRAQQFIDSEIKAVQDRVLRADCELSQVEQANGGSGGGGGGKAEV